MERGAKVIAAAGGIVLLVAMFLDWYSIAVIAGNVPGAAALAAQDHGSNAWQAFAWVDMALFLAVVASVSALAFGDRVPGLGAARFVAAIGALAGALIVWRLIDQPFEAHNAFARVEATNQVGAYLGLAGALLIAAGGGLQLRSRT